MGGLNDLTFCEFPDALDFLEVDHPQERQLASMDQNLASGASTYDEGLTFDVQAEQGSFEDDGEQNYPFQMGGTSDQHAGTGLWPEDAINGQYRLPKLPPFDVYGTWLPSEPLDPPLQPLSHAEPWLPTMVNANFYAPFFGRFAEYS